MKQFYIKTQINNRGHGVNASIPPLATLISNVLDRIYHLHFLKIPCSHVTERGCMHACISFSVPPCQLTSTALPGLPMQIGLCRLKKALLPGLLISPTYMSVGLVTSCLFQCDPIDPLHEMVVQLLPPLPPVSQIISDQVRVSICMVSIEACLSVSREPALPRKEDSRIPTLYANGDLFGLTGQ